LCRVAPEQQEVDFGFDAFERSVDLLVLMEGCLSMQSEQGGALGPK
jgi:hypothetical protein